MTPVFTGAPIIVTATFGDGDNGWLQELRRAHYPPERNRVPAHLARAAAAPPPAAAVAGIIDLGEGTALRVESAVLEAIRADLVEAFHGLLTPQDLAPWQPHVTIQNKVAPREARALQQRLRLDLTPRPLAIRALAAWRYRDGPWEALRSYSFRG